MKKSNVSPLNIVVSVVSCLSPPIHHYYYLYTIVQCTLYTVHCTVLQLLQLLYSLFYIILMFLHLKYTLYLLHYIPSLYISIKYILKYTPSTLYLFWYIHQTMMIICAFVHDLCICSIYNVHLFYIQCTLYIEHCTLYIVHYILNIVYCTLYNI